MIGMTLFGGVAFSQQRRKLKSAVALGVLFVILIATAPPEVWERFSGLRYATSTTNLAEVDPEGSAEQRFEIWNVAARVAIENPITGAGIGAYEIAHFYTAQDPDFNPDRLGGTAMRTIRSSRSPPKPGFRAWRYSSG